MSDDNYGTPGHKRGLTAAGHVELEPLRVSQLDACGSSGPSRQVVDPGIHARASIAAVSRRRPSDGTAGFANGLGASQSRAVEPSESRFGPGDKGEAGRDALYEWGSLRERRAAVGGDVASAPAHGPDRTPLPDDAAERAYDSG